MRISENLVVQLVGDTKLVLVDDTDRTEMVWSIDGMHELSQFAEYLDQVTRDQTLGICTVKGKAVEGNAITESREIEMPAVEFTRFAFAAGFLIGSAR